MKLIRNILVIALLVYILLGIAPAELADGITRFAQTGADLAQRVIENFQDR